jgi:hypothetical protein
VKRHSYCFEVNERDVDKAVEELSALATDEGELYVIVCEVGNTYR